MKKTLVILMMVSLLCGCTQMGLFGLNSLARINTDNRVTRNIQYGVDDNDWQTLDVYQPTPSTQTPRLKDNVQRPVIMFLYGGGWTTGKKSQYYFAAAAFTRLGYVVAVPDYVKYPEGKFPQFINDGALSVKWVKDNIADYGGNPDEVFIVGHSAGAHLGALLLADPQYLNKQGLSAKDVKGFAGLAGPYSFTPKRKPYTQVFAPASNYPQMNVVNFVDGDEPPMLLAHGANDSTVEVGNLQRLAKVLEQHNVTHKTAIYDKMSHTKILLSLHPSWNKKHSTVKDIHVFFQSIE